LKERKKRKKERKKTVCQPKSSLGRLRREIRSPNVYDVYAILISKNPAQQRWPPAPAVCWVMSTA